MPEFISPNCEALFAENDALTIQNAIDLSVKDGCRQVCIPRYNLRTGKAEWRIDRALRLPSDFTLILDNCYMVQETGIYDHMFTNELSYSEERRTLAGEQHDITILGKGNVCLDGGVHNHLLEKTSSRYGLPRVWKNTMFYWVNVRDLRVENLHIENQRWWAITHICCRNVTIRNISYDAIPHVPNMDGIDLRIGCNNFFMENITGRTGDDVIAMTALKGSHEVANTVEGKDTHIHDVKVRNCIGDPYLHFVVRLLNHDGNELYNIDLDTVYDMSDVTTKKRPRCTLGVGGVLYSNSRRALPGETRAITARNLTARGELAVRIDNTMEDAVITNIKTYGDNIGAVGTQGGTQLHNVVFEDLYYGRTQMEIFCSKPLSPEEYTGVVVDLANCQGDITFKDLHVDKVRTLAKGDRGMTVTVDGLEADCITVMSEMGESKLIVDGKELANG